MSDSLDPRDAANFIKLRERRLVELKAHRKDGMKIYNTRGRVTNLSAVDVEAVIKGIEESIVEYKSRL